ncbi:uncharacterized protein BROUX77_007792 [Berkeleyomyces rouxiae]|uniref:uncharacterized protein n=1 Tax=Berkeleyomyces rouxiae TaxID=2035830 RepID=UPI003B7B6D97
MHPLRSHVSYAQYTSAPRSQSLREYDYSSAALLASVSSGVDCEAQFQDMSSLGFSAPGFTTDPPDTSSYDISTGDSVPSPSPAPIIKQEDHNGSNHAWSCEEARDHINNESLRPKRRRENRYKDASPAVISRRRAQNRASQRAYRERKDQRIRDLENELQNRENELRDQKEAIARLQSLCDGFRRQNIDLVQNSAAKTISFPSHAVGSEMTANVHIPPSYELPLAHRRGLSESSLATLSSLASFGRPPPTPSPSSLSTSYQNSQYVRAGTPRPLKPVQIAVHMPTSSPNLSVGDGWAIYDQASMPYLSMHDREPCS